MHRMKLNNKIFWSIVLCITGLMGFSQQSTYNKDSRPNILWIMAEDMSIDLGCYGMPAVKTPVLDELAATGIQFMNCYGTNSICSPEFS